VNTAWSIAGSPDWMLWLRLGLQGAVLVGLGQAAWWSSALLRTPRDGAERLLAALVLLLGAMTMIPTLWGLMGLLSPFTLTLSAAVAWGAALVKARPASVALRAAPRPERLPLWLRTTGLVAACAYAAPLLRSLFEVPVRWDTLTYHLFLPARWIQSGHVSNPDFPYPLRLVGHYPKHQELFLTSATGVARNDLFAEVSTLVVYLSVALGVYGLVARLGGSRAAAFAAGAFALTLPAHFIPAAGAYAEGLLTLSVLAALVFGVASLDAARAGSARIEPWLLCGLALGLAVGTKYTALPLAALVGLALGLAALGGRGEVPARAFGAFFGAALASGGVWYALNTVSHGNPFHPVPLWPFATTSPTGMSWDANILNQLGRLIESGALLRKWLEWDAQHPWMPFVGWKLVPATALALYGAIALPRARVTGAWLVVGAFVVLWFGYLRAPYFRPEWLSTQTRLVPPAICVGLALGFAALSRHRIPTSAWVAIVLGGLALDVAMLDLRVPDLVWNERYGRFAFGWMSVPTRLAIGRVFVAALATGVVAVSLWTARRGAAPRCTTWLRIGGAMIVCALLIAPWIREPIRYVQYERAGPVGPKRRYSPAAAWLELHHPARPIAAVNSRSLEFLYLFSGRGMDRRIEDAKMREGADEAAWHRTLLDSQSELLVCMRWPRQPLPPEVEVAMRLGLTELYRDHDVTIFELTPD